jgi:hypothetical protein
VKTATWDGGKARTHEELDAADQGFWRRAGPGHRFLATLELADFVEMLAAFADAGVRYAAGLHRRRR